MSLNNYIDTYIPRTSLTGMLKSSLWLVLPISCGWKKLSSMHLSVRSDSDFYWDFENVVNQIKFCILWWIIMFPEKQRMVAKFSSCSQKSTYKFCINPSFSYCRGWACYKHPLMVGMEHQVDVLVEFLLKRPSELKFQLTNILT